MAQSAKSLLAALIAATALLAITADARLKIMSPHSLANEFKSKSNPNLAHLNLQLDADMTVRANYANFGFIPYG